MDLSTELFRQVASPVMESGAFSRLKQITFLGVLSPRYRELAGFPIKYKTPLNTSDQTRAHHSLSVAVLAGRICANLRLSETSISYAVMWGLLHDIATWPLSHTGEAGFSRSTETSARDLRAMMIRGSNRLSKAVSLYPHIKASALDHGTLIALYDRNETGFSQELTVIHKLIHSAVTPDTLDGIYRSGRVFNIKIPEPMDFVGAFERDLISGVVIGRDFYRPFRDFWRGKSEIYSKYINAQRTMEFESIWSRTIQDEFARIPLRETLELSEDDVVRRVVDSVPVKPRGIQRYKEPLSYFIADTYKGRREFKPRFPIDELSSVFIRKIASGHLSGEAIDGIY
ncbi:MAG: HD domain-containing protein [Alphaproteobacteria bacterium]